MIFEQFFADYIIPPYTRGCVRGAMAEVLSIDNIKNNIREHVRQLSYEREENEEHEYKYM